MAILQRRLVVLTASALCVPSQLDIKGYLLNETGAHHFRLPIFIITLPIHPSTYSLFQHSPSEICLGLRNQAWGRFLVFYVQHSKWRSGCKPVRSFGWVCIACIISSCVDSHERASQQAYKSVNMDEKEPRSEKLVENGRLGKILHKKRKLATPLFCELQLQW